MTDADKIKILAEKVMGWGMSDVHVGYWLCSEESPMWCRKESSWDPIQSIEDAWSLLENLKEDLPVIYYADGEWTCELFIHDKNIAFEKSAKTAPRAISEAALEWVESRKEDT